MNPPTPHPGLQRRRVLAGGAAALAGAGLPLLARAQAAGIDLPIANGHRNIAAYPEKRPLIVLTTRPPQLETPFEVFNDGLLTPNDAFFVRYHNAAIPTSIDGDAHTIRIGGNAVGKPFQIGQAHEGSVQGPGAGRGHAGHRRLPGQDLRQRAAPVRRGTARRAAATSAARPPG